MTSSIIFSMARGVGDLLRLLALVDGGEVLVLLEAGVEELLEHLAGEFARLGEVGREDDAVHRDRATGRARGSASAQAHGQLADQQGGDALGALRLLRRRFEAGRRRRAWR